MSARQTVLVSPNFLIVGFVAATANMALTPPIPKATPEFQLIMINTWINF